MEDRLVQRERNKVVSGLQRTSPALVGALLLCLPTACGQDSGKSDSPTGVSPTTNDEWSIPANSAEDGTEAGWGRSLKENWQDPSPGPDSSMRLKLRGGGGVDDPGGPQDRGRPEDGGYPDERGGAEERGYDGGGGGPEERESRDDWGGYGDPSGASDSRYGYGSSDSGTSDQEGESWPRRFGYAAKRRLEETLPIAPKTGLIIGDSQQGSERTIQVDEAGELGKVGEFKLLVYGFAQENLNDQSLPQKGKPPELLWISEFEVETWPTSVEFRVPADPSFNLLPVVDVNGDSRMGPGDFFGPGVNVGSLDEIPVSLSIDRLLEEAADRPLGEPDNGGAQNESPFPSAAPPSQGCGG